MTIECAQCGSTELTKLSIIYAEGLSDLKARSRGWGLTFGSGGADLGFVKLRTEGEIQTKLSRQLSPPRKWSYWKIVFGGLVGLLTLEFVLGYLDTFLRASGSFNQQLAWFGYSCLGVIAFILSIAFRHNVWTVPRRRRLWDQSFMCRHCGQVLQRSQPDHPETERLIREAHP